MNASLIVERKWLLGRADSAEGRVEESNGARSNELEAHQSHEYRMKRMEVYVHFGDIVARLLGVAIRYISVLGALYLCIDSIGRNFAGQETGIEFILHFLGNVYVSHTISFTISVSAIFYAWRQKQLKNTTVEKLHRRIKDLERRMDPNRSSSTLTARGETNPEDQI
jgi:hypothetical protein